MSGFRGKSNGRQLRRPLRYVIGRKPAMSRHSSDQIEVKRNPREAGFC